MQKSQWFKTVEHRIDMFLAGNKETFMKLAEDNVVSYAAGHLKKYSFLRLLM